MTNLYGMTTMWTAAALSLCSLLIAGARGENSYVITAPQTIQPGQNYDLRVDIVNETNVLVVATLRDQVYNGYSGKTDFKNIVNASGTFGKGSSGKLTLPIESDIICSSCQVHIRGTGDLQFENVIYTSINTDVVVILVQTDKAIYKADQRVNFRVFAVDPKLKLYTGTFNIEIRDPNNNRIKVLKNVTDPYHVVEDSLLLSEQPVYGTWNIEVTLEEVNEFYKQSFEVSEYTLPKFEVTVELSPYALVSDDLLTGKIKAKYTFGQPVKGFVELHVGPNQGPNSCGDLPRTTQIGFEIDGEASFSIPKEDINRAVLVNNGQEVKVTAFVKDATGVRLNGSSVIKFYANKYQVKFTDNTPSVFKPGLAYKACIQVTTPDNKPPTENNITLSVYTCVTYQQTVDDQNFYDTAQFTGNYGLPGQNLTVPVNGLLCLDLDIPKNATKIAIKATVNDVYATKTVEKVFSQRNQFIQLSLLAKDVKAGETVSVRVDGTEPIDDATYEVLSRGSLVASGSLDGEGRTSFSFDLKVTSIWSPTSHLLVYYTKDKEIVADSLAFKVEGTFENKVTVSFNKNESEPNKELSLDVTAEPGSQVYTVVVDQSVLLLKSGNDITSEKVDKAMDKFDKGEKPSDSDFALSYSAPSVQEIFSKSGIILLTDVPTPSPPIRYGRMPYGRSALTPGLPGPPGYYRSSANYYDAVPMPISLHKAESVASIKVAERVRQYFPEVWFWDSTATSENGTASFPVIVPDPITSWIASAFATHPTIGLGVAPTTATLKVFRTFFVSLTLPLSVVRGEHVVIQAVVFNYLPNSASVTVTLKGSSEFQNVKPLSEGLEAHEPGDQVKQIKVNSQEQGIVYFPILVSEIGLIDIEVSAQTTDAADAIHTQMNVRPEGAPVSFNYPVFANLGENGTFQKTIDFPLPDSVVNGSDRARIKVTGDLLSSSSSSLTSLLQLPTGCGEQSLAITAPNLYVAEYLNATGQFTTILEAEILSHLEAGYQRQLTYQRSDGSFSAFGNSDESGNTWLTAYVARVYSKVDKFIYIDPQVLIRAIDWLVDRQNKDGSFNEFGKVLDSTTQGTGAGPALSSFILLSLIENAPLANTDCKKDEECPRVYRWGNATAKVTSHLESLVDSDSIKDQFSLSVTSYALTLAKSSKANTVFEKLEGFAHKEGGLRFWSDNSTTTRSEYISWIPPHVQSRPIGNLITSYAILTYTAKGQLEEAFPAVRWLTMQRNSFGGFASSQDTSVGLQALAAYASKAIRPDTNLDVKISQNGVTLAEFQITKENALVLQIQELKSIPPKVDISVSGTGLAVIEIGTTFNVNKELSTPSFDVSTVLLDDNLDSFNLMICTKWLWDRETGMVVQEVSIPSGFAPDLGSLGNVAGLKRLERRGNNINIYFDKIDKTSVCYSIRMTRTDKTARTQENSVVTWVYYDPRDQATVFYQPKKLRDSSVCDVCDGCCP